MKCKKCKIEMSYQLWNTEKGDDEGWYCNGCDTYYPNMEKRRK